MQQANSYGSTIRCKLSYILKCRKRLTSQSEGDPCNGECTETMQTHNLSYFSRIVNTHWAKWTLADLKN